MEKKPENKISIQKNGPKYIKFMFPEARSDADFRILLQKIERRMSDLFKKPFRANFKRVFTGDRDFVMITFQNKHEYPI